MRRASLPDAPSAPLARSAVVVLLQRFAAGDGAALHELRDALPEAAATLYRLRARQLVVEPDAVDALAAALLAEAVR